MTRYPFATLARAMGLTEPQAARALKMAPASELKYRREGMSELVADRMAVKAGFVPYAIWPEWLEETTQPCDDCGCGFVPARKDGRFCSRLCYRRWWAREVARARRSRPELAERNRQRRRAYYAENAEYEKARERRRYRARKAA